MAMQVPRAAPILGRDRELGLLRSALAEALSGRGRLVLVSGEPGIGKSTLVAALAAEAAEQGARVLAARAPETAGAPPYWLWTQVLRLELQPEGAGPGRPAGFEGAESLGRILPELQTDTEDRADAAAESEAWRFRLADEIATFLLERARDSRRVIVLDDLHAADASSLGALAHLAGRLEASPLLILATYRDVAQELTPALSSLLARAAREASTVRIPLAGLEVAAVRSQLAAIIGRDVDSELASRVHARTGGNPFFTAEVARVLTEQAVGGAAAPPPVPPGIRDVVASRLGRLPDSTREILDRAALLGQEMPVDILAAACGADPATVLAGLEPALQAALMRPAAAPAHLRFSHGLVAEAIVDALPVSRAGALHEEVALAIEQRRRGDLDDWLPALAHHWGAAAPTERAARRTLETARLAALQAEARLAPDDAARLWRTALDAAGRAGSDVGVRAELKVGLARSLFAGGEVAQAVEVAVSAAEDAQSSERQDLVTAAALVVEGVSEPQWAAALIALAERALSQDHAAGPAVRARLHAQVGQLVHLTSEGGPERERSETSRAVELADSSGDPRAMQAALRAQQLVVSGPEDVEARLGNAARMVGIGRASGDPWPEFWGRLWTFDALVQLGRLAEAELETQELEPVVARLRWPVARWHLLRARAALHQVRGRFGDALATADEALAQISGAGLDRAEGLHTTFLEAQADLVGELPGGEERLRRLLELVVREPHVTVRAITSLVRVGRFEEAGAFYARLPPPGRWNPPPYVLAVQLSERMVAAARLQRRDEVRELLARFEPLARWHVAFGSGAHVSLGSGFAYTGIAAGHLGDGDRAISDLTRAVEDNTRAGATVRAITARQELAEALEIRSSGTDVESARRLASTVASDSQRFGMRPTLERAQALLKRIPRNRVRSEELTPRELEIAQLLTQGLTNRQLAARLGISERTAENHVDHILSKLGFSSRAQVAAWAASRKSRFSDG